MKSYNQPRRERHQQINQAARELGMMVVEEGGSTLNHNLPMILDGVTSIEHNLPVAPLYRDVVELWKHRRAQHAHHGGDLRRAVRRILVVRTRQRLGRRQAGALFPRETLDARSIRREIGPDWDYYHIEVAKAAKALRDAGVKIGWAATASSRASRFTGKSGA